MYKLLPDHPVYGKLHTVQRLSDNAFIPFDESNTDYIAYLEWCKTNTPLPAENT